MRLVRWAAPDAAQVVGRVSGDHAVPILADPGPGRDALVEALHRGIDLAHAAAVGDPVALHELPLLAPVVRPGKILAIGLNYRDHARESGMEVPSAPLLFSKAPTAIVGPGAPIRFDTADTSEVDYEAELAVVIGRSCRNVTADAALDAVLGYTCCNDVSARDAQFADGQWVRGKSFDTFCPLGPALVGGDEIADPQALPISCRVNGVTLQSSSTAEMIFGVADLIAYLSRFMTLEPGDVIATGTPFGVGFSRRPPVWLGDGDRVEVEIAGIGVLANPVSIGAAPSVGLGDVQPAEAARRRQQ